MNFLHLHYKKRFIITFDVILLAYLNINKSFHLGSYWFHEVVKIMQLLMEIPHARLLHKRKIFVDC